MSAANGQSGNTATPTAPKPSLAEPSMEDILASIRRIIATDHYGTAEGAGIPGASRRAPAVAAAEAQAPTIEAEAAPQQPEPATLNAHGFEATSEAAPAEEYVHPDAPEVVAEVPEVQSHYEEVEAAPEVAHAAIIDEPEPQHAQSAWEETPAASYAYEPAIDSYTHDHGTHLATTDYAAPLLSPNTDAVVSSSFQALAESIFLQDPEMVERLAAEAIRPLLKSWLDDNLPSMVERLVRAEIERVARGGRSRN